MTLILICNNFLLVSDFNLVMGIDEAGRGPVLGPMVVAGVVLDSDSDSLLQDLGIKDSKKLSSKLRSVFFEHINNEAYWFKTTVIWPDVIDSFVNRKALNHLECDLMSQIIDSWGKPIKVYVDSPQKPEVFKSMIESRLNTSSIDIECSFKADDIFPVVSAAGILAKVTRDTIMEELREEYGDFGSGYPADPKTKNFIEGFNEATYPYFVRKSWKTLVHRQACLF